MTVNKNNLYIAVASMAAIFIVIFIAYSQGGKDSDSLLLDREGTIHPDSCTERGLDDKIIVIHSKYCSACKIVMPLLEEIEGELGAEFIYIDISESEGLNRMEEFRIHSKYTPTVLIGCDIYIGEKSKEEYKTPIEEFLGK